MSLVSDVPYLRQPDIPETELIHCPFRRIDLACASEHN